MHDLIITIYVLKYADELILPRLNLENKIVNSITGKQSGLGLFLSRQLKLGAC
jgi:hypothetical protein